MKTNKMIAMNIIAAQVYSDMAKAYPEDREIFYAKKGECIENAIHLICRHHPREYRFSVQKGDISQHIIYFTFRNGNERLQISFHSFSDGLRKYVSHQKTRWDKKSSRQACKRLAEIEGIYNDLKSQNKYDSLISIWNKGIEKLV